MRNQNLETTLFARAIERVQFNLKFLDLHLDDWNSSRTMWENLRFRWHFWCNIFLLNVATVGETAWLLKGISTGKSFMELCYQGPCLTLCIVCDLQCVYFVKHRHRILELIASIRTLQIKSTELQEPDARILRKLIRIFYIAVNALTIMMILAISLFGLIPFVTMYLSYYETGKVEFVLPFLIIYPFNATDIRFWPIAYVHQIWAGETRQI